MQAQMLNGRYEMLTPLGQGGMATVYRGRDTRLGRPVAIKLLHNYYATDDEFLQRFQHEAMSAAHLSSHPNIVDVYDVGKDGDLNYIVMELIDGEDLKAYIEREASLPPEQALNIAAQVAEGLDYAHRRGLIHRDVKPQNVLITPEGEVRIADFGIAKSHLSTAVTQAGMTFGTADYISPEQAQGRIATPQSDIYSLGIMLYEMLTGRLPFQGDTPMAVAIQHIQKPPPSLRQFNPSVPPALDALVLRAIAKDAQQRPASAKAFAQELRNYLAGRMQQTFVNPQAYSSGGYYDQQAAPPQPRTYPQSGPSPRQRDDRAPTYQPPTPPRRVPQRPQYAAPPPLAPVAPARERNGVGFGTLVLGLLLLSGLLALIWFALNTNISDLFNFGAGVTSSSAPVASAAPEPTAQPTGTPVATVELPTLIGLTETQVVGPGGLFERLNLRRRADPNDPLLQPRNDPAPRGTIIFQDPAPGTQVPVGSEISIAVSLGPEVIDLRDVTRQRFEEAQAALQQAGFVVQRQDAPSQSVPAGFVISQNPAGNVRLPKGETITLTVSQGDVVAFPDVIANGTLRDQAIQAIQAAGFTIVAEDQQGPEVLGDRFNSFLPNEVVSATANGDPVDQRGKLVPRGARVAIGVRAP